MENMNKLSVEVDGTVMGEVGSFYTHSGATDLELSADIRLLPQVLYLFTYVFSLLICFLVCTQGVW